MTREDRVRKTLEPFRGETLADECMTVVRRCVVALMKEEREACENTLVSLLDRYPANDRFAMGLAAAITAIRART